MRAPNDPLDLFLQAAAANPDRPAVIGGDETVSYRELAGCVARLARAIRTADTPHPRVAISLPKGAWAYAAMFGTFLAGGFYTPLNLDHPIGNRNRAIALFRPDVVVAMNTAEIDALAVPEGCRGVAVEDLPRTGASLDPAPKHDLAYVMFTSGSTGLPKGVMISRDALAHYVAWAHEAMAVTPEDRWSQHPNIAFDLSVLDIYGALCAGACLYPILSRKDRLLPADAIRRHKLTIWNSVPSVVDLMVQAQQATPDRFATLRLATFCGEPLLEQHVEALFRARPDLQVHNTYGPTEATVSMTLVRLNAANFREKCSASVALGAPIPGMHMLLEGSEDPSEGEAVIAGPQVARGYWQDPDLADTVFGERIVDGKPLPAYRTGDWVRRDGEDLYFVARVDRQIKRNGFRLELGEIDAACREAGAAASCTVYVDQNLVSFVEGIDEAGKQFLLRKLADKLPNHAIPTEVRPLPALPRNANDKIDSQALEAILRQG